MKKTAKILVIAGVCLLAVSFLFPLLDPLFIGKAEAATETRAYWDAFRTYAPLTYTCFITGILALCSSILVFLVYGWVKNT